MASNFYNPRFQPLDGNGKPYSGSKLYVYTQGTTTPVTTYSDADLTVAQTSPVVADSNGVFPAIYIQSGEYKFRLTTSTDVDVWTQDNIASPITTTGGDIAVSDGGTGASDAAGARLNLGAASDADVTVLSSSLAAVQGQINSTEVGGTLRELAGKSKVLIEDFGADLTGILQIGRSVFSNAGMQDTAGAEVATLSLTPKRADSSFLVLSGGVAVTSSDQVQTTLGLFRSGVSASLNAQLNQPNGRAAETMVSIVSSGGTDTFTLSLRTTATSFPYENPYIVAIEFVATPVS